MQDNPYLPCSAGIKGHSITHTPTCHTDVAVPMTVLHACTGHLTCAVAIKLQPPTTLPSLHAHQYALPTYLELPTSCLTHSSNAHK